MLRLVVRLFVMLAAAFLLFSEAQDVGAWECRYEGYECDGEGCGRSSPTAPTRQHRYDVFRCCFEGGPDGGEWCTRTSIPTYRCCAW